MYKTGQIREDGKIFYSYGRFNGTWLTKEKYHHKIQKRRAYQRKCYLMYKSLHKIKRKVGEYCSKKKLYFVGISGSGKEMWKDANHVLKLRERQKKYRINYLNKCKKDILLNLKFKDRHPSNPNLFVLYKRGNRLFFGTAKQLEIRRQKLRESYKKRNEKYKIIRARIVVNKKYKRGDKNPKNDTLFWYYSKRGNEIWLSPQDFMARHDKDKQKQIIYHKRKLERRSENINKSCS